MQSAVFGFPGNWQLAHWLTVLGLLASQCTLAGVRFNLGAFFVRIFRLDAVGGKSGSRGNEPSQDHVLFEAVEAVNGAAYRRFDQDARGVLEGCRREEGLFRQRDFGDAQDELFALCTLFACLFNECVFLREFRLFDNVTDGEACFTRRADLAPREHLLHDHFDVLARNTCYLCFIDLVDLTDDVALCTIHSSVAEKLVDVGVPVGNEVARLHLLPDLNQRLATEGNRVFDFFLFFLFLSRRFSQDDDDPIILFARLDVRDDTPDLCDHRLRFWRLALENVFNARQSHGDVFACRTTPVQGAHRQLCPRFTDGLRGDDPHGLTKRNHDSASKVHAVALLAHTAKRPALKRRAHEHLLCARLLERDRFVATQERAFLENNFSIFIKRVLCKHAA